jgi:hypothetical protein
MTSAKPLDAASSTLIHRSVHTSTSVNSWPADTAQSLEVITGRLTVAWKDGDVAIEFAAHRLRTAIDAIKQERARRGLNR